MRLANPPRAIPEGLAQYTPLLRAMATPYARLGVSRQDLEQEGALGLLDAAERFDPERGASFASYARWWIRYRMQRYLRANRAIVAMPQTRAVRLARRKLRSATAELESRGGTRASNAEIASYLGIDESDVAIARAELTRRDVEMVPDRDSAAGYEPDRELPDPEQATARRELRTNAERFVRSVLECLDPRERRIVSERCLSDQPRSLRDLGEELSVSAERVRQLEKRAFKKMRAALEARGWLQTARHCALALAA